MSNEEGYLEEKWDELPEWIAAIAAGAAVLAYACWCAWRRDAKI